MVEDLLIHFLSWIFIATGVVMCLLLGTLGLWSLNNIIRRKRNSTPFDTWCNDMRMRLATEFDKLGGTSWVEKYLDGVLDIRKYERRLLIEQRAQRWLLATHGHRAFVHLVMIEKSKDGKLWCLTVRFAAPRKITNELSFLAIDACFVVVEDNHGTYALFLKDSPRQILACNGDPIKKAIASTYGVKENQYNLIART